MPRESTSGTGHLRSGQRDLGSTHYEIHVGFSDKPDTVVELESPPRAQDGEVLQLTLEDGRVLLCQVRGLSPYCRVLGEKSAAEPSEADAGPPRRRPEPRTAPTILHSCPRCLATETFVTHRGVTMTTLFCPVCGHGWSESTSAVAGAPRLDRRAAVRPESSDRRALSRLATPYCGYCSTDVHVRSVRHTASEVYFVCGRCDAMWVRPRPPRSPG